MSNRTYLMRLIVPFAVMIIVVVTLSGWLIYHAGHAQALKRQAERLINDASLLARTIRDDGSQLQPAVIARADAEAKFRNVRVSIIDRNGGVVFDSHLKVAELDDHNTRPEVIEARATGLGQAIRVSSSMGVSTVYAAALVDAQSGYVVRTSRPEEAGLEISNLMLAQLGGAILVSILIMTWLALTLQRRWIAPVLKLANAAEQMAAGQWQTRVEPTGGAELRAFSKRINAVAMQARKQVDDLEHQRKDLESLADSLPDPIILTDSQQRVVLLNHPATLFLGVTPKQAMGAKMFSILGETSLLDIYEQVAADQVKPGVAIMRDIRVMRAGQKMTYQAVAARTPAGGLVMVLRDITRMTSTVQMKTDFVANASHELRTPIAAIKLAFETLREVYHDDANQTERCITIIGGHLQRLEDMLQDLLDLSRVENADIKPEIQLLRGEDILAVVAQTQEPIAHSKQIELLIEGDDSLVFYSDRRLLDLVLKNLVENSIKYTPPGGLVRVRLWQESQTIRLKVSDTGIGIPPQHTERVFERFYQVDSTRASSVGRGTGLGLAIVKHALHALQGQVKLDSTVGQGTTVTCIFPTKTNPLPQNQPPDIHQTTDGAISESSGST